MRRAFPLVLCLLAPLGLVACGGGSSSELVPVSPTETVAPLSKSEYIQQADGICAEANAAIGALPTDSSTNASQTAEILDGVLAGLDGLSPPSEDRTTLDRFLNAFRDQVNAQKDADLASQRNDAGGASDAETRAGTAADEAKAAATEYGFQDCGQGPSSVGATGATGPVAPSTPTTSTPAAPTPAPAPPPPSGGGGGGGGGSSGGVGPP